MNVDSLKFDTGYFWAGEVTADHRVVTIILHLMSCHSLCSDHKFKASLSVIWSISVESRRDLENDCTIAAQELWLNACDGCRLDSVLH